MKIRRVRWMTTMLVLLVGVTLSADRVRLRSGKTVEGMFIGADSKAVRILLEDGRVSEVPLDEAASIEFSARKPAPPPPPPAPASAKPPAPAAASATTQASPPPPKMVTVPAGSTVNVRLTQSIDVDVSQAGQTFKAIVDDPVMMNGSIVIPRGASAVVQAVQVQQSGKMKGSDKISLKLNSIGFGGMVYEVTTGYVEAKGSGEGKKTARKVGGGAGLGAIVGGIAGGGSGAAIGAAVGGATGAAVAAGGQEHLKLPAETRLQFQLSAAVKVRG
jgi:hypothetical protein